MSCLLNLAGLTAVRLIRRSAPDTFEKKEGEICRR